jgi:hypothetical protein
MGASPYDNGGARQFVKKAPVGAPSFARPSMTAVWLIGSFIALGEPMEIRNAASAMVSAAWLEVREQTACEAMQDDYCLGRYGFTIKHDGTFIAGPSGRGTKAEGRLERQELRRLREFIGHLSTMLPSEDTNCDPGGLPGIKDQVDITFSGGQVVRAYDLGGRVGKICYVGTWDRVRKLHEYLHELMTRYYPVPFPKI